LKKGLPKSTFYLVIDRMAFADDDRGRLVDSLTQAYDASTKYNSNVSSRRARIITTDGRQIKVSEDRCCPICDYTPPPVTSSLFSFNSPIGACPSCKGFGNILDIDEAKVVPNPNLSLAAGALNPFTMPSAAKDRRQLLAYCKKVGIDVHTPWFELPPAQRKMVWDGTDEFFGVKGLFEYLEQMKYKMHVRVFISRYRSPFLCPTCHGSRLRPEAHHVYAKGQSIQDLSQKTIEDLCKVFQEMKLTKSENDICGEVVKQIRSRLEFLMRVGVHYLSLNRETRTLSGGEFQRLNLANQLGMGLSQTLYVLDEPTVGLHPRDNDRLISILKDLKDLGNTLVVVEHDHDVIRSSEHLIEMGPGSGMGGGTVVYEGLTKDFYKFKGSNTARYLLPYKKDTSLRQVPPVDANSHKYKIELRGAHGHNLKNIDVVFPLHRLVTVTGVSGSGKSTLVSKTLYPALAKALDIEYEPTQPFNELRGVEHIKNVVLIDQSPIGKSARSNPVTYMKAFDVIRTIMAGTPEAKARGYTPGTFSLNVDGGRCPTCKGTGFEEIDMQFMDNVVVPCDTCDGQKYRPEILEIQYNGKNINEILKFTVQEAMNFFVNHPNLRKRLALLKEVGLEYLQLGQPANSLSGGESQRMKIARELSQVQQKATLYILDEPTTGLHFREVELLMKILHKLIEGGGSVLVVEHNLDVILGSHYVIDLGPEAGDRGGEIVAQGTPEDIMASKASLTGEYLLRYVGTN
jgi:excinuclease ABC subunit A